MIEHIKQLFKECRNKGQYKRVDAKHPLDVYIGVNPLGELSLAAIEFSNIKMVKSTRAINAVIRQRLDGRRALEFSLKDDQFLDIFCLFCDDMVTLSRNYPKDDAIRLMVKRWDAWKRMFNNAKPEILSEEEIKGLLGELNVLIELTNSIGEEKALNAWIGPDGSHKDFVFDNTWHEVKTCSLSKDTVKISSLEQLDSENEGQLKIVVIEKTNTEDDDAVNLNSMVKKIETNLDNAECLDVFFQKLKNAGYSYMKAYDDLVFKIIRTDTYLVRTDFPRISRKDVPNAIQSVQYDLHISSIGEFKI